VTPYFDQLYDHPQACHAHKTKITMASFIVGQNEISLW